MQLEAYKNISPESGYPTIVHPNYNQKIRNWKPPKPVRTEFKPSPDRALHADPQKKSLLNVAKQVDLTDSIGTVLENVQLSQLTLQQLDELALLVSERGVVFFRDQDLTTKQQVKLFEHYGVLDHPPGKDEQRHVVINGCISDHRQQSNYTPWSQACFHADTSFELNPPSYSLLRMEKHPPVGGDTAWISQYGLYDALSTPYQRLLDSIHAIHTSRLQYDTILDLYSMGPDHPPIDTHHPAVRTHPVTNLRALNVNEGFVVGFAELKKAESDTRPFQHPSSPSLSHSLLQFLLHHMHSADDHYVRFKWAVGSVAMWDNRCTVHRAIPGAYELSSRLPIRTSVLGEKPFFDPQSESRMERETKLNADG
ncbi:alpha-ketoglutarate-dependent sulfonate dioxygenase [Ampelomyces quisqualis]|uniref:Alpha-ketoglutarate-dependent sulfonate dioxygenase n=1 Tax=Ampelomyces quisqualis TaxID=50730 RepID=A0A6A5R2L8_AMPQU|nr:alpha-ketoglutarate-dependent sulfonate dioxygenase [Ampelomyces quisqualis]